VACEGSPRARGGRADLTRVGFPFYSQLLSFYSQFNLTQSHFIALVRENCA